MTSTIAHLVMTLGLAGLTMILLAITSQAKAACPGGFYAMGADCLSLDSQTSGGDPLPETPMHLRWDEQGNYLNVHGDGYPMDIYDSNDDGEHSPEEMSVPFDEALEAYNAAWSR